MKFQLVSPIAPIGVNYSNSELALHIRHYYPNLDGALLELLDRFEGKRSIDGVFAAVRKDEDVEARCPGCGSVLALVQSEE